MEMLASGGNAVDASIAADAVLGVVAPETCGIGGDLFALVHGPSLDAPVALNASGRAGAGADPERLRSEGHKSMPPFHPQSVTVPGCVDGWDHLVTRFGRLDLERILQPAIRLARDGFPASFELSGSLRARREVLAPQIASEGLFPKGGPPEPGDRLIRPGLATTLASIARDGAGSFYTGAVAKAITEATGGVITDTDMASGRADWIAPLGLELFGLTGWTIPPNSQGYLTLGSLGVWAQLDPPDDPESALSWHLAIESYRSMAVDRDDVVSDPATAPLAPDDLISPQRLRARAAMVDRDRTTGFTAPSPRPGGTAYLCAIDAEGLGVSFIQSNFMGIGSGIGVGTAGFFLHNRGAGFDLRPGHPNHLTPGRRPLHTLSPTLWTRQGRLAALLGTRGGDHQPQFLLQMAIRLFNAGVEPGDAQSRPRWMIDPFAAGSPEVSIEPEASPEVEKRLRAMGHAVSRRQNVQPGWGPISVIAISEDGLRTAAADPRVATTAAAVA
jgi:gamma-glutamyltranspeptidase/glutathione hydrolase